MEGYMKGNFKGLEWRRKSARNVGREYSLQTNFQ
jgi:hypothetical protein